MADAPLVLVLNAGSSSLKFAAFRGDSVALRDKVERIPAGGHDAAVHQALDTVRAKFPGETISAVGHRVLHGGDKFTAPTVVSPDVLTALEELIPLGPLHQPHNIAGIRAVAGQLPDVPQVACFDTAFHATMPKVERMFGLPRRYFDAGVKRYGFHGLAYESVVSHLRDRGELPERLIACHLGNGASLCAIRAGKSVATTMGFTPLDGLLMGTRPGHLDPGAVLYLERHDGLSADQVDHILEKESGLLGVSGGIASDMRDLLSSPEPVAAEAVELFCYRIVRDIGAMAAALEGVDAIAFSGGIGENAPAIRERICRRLGWLGAVPVHVVPADEESVIARATRAASLGEPQA
jgi:acetate kinase